MRKKIIKIEDVIGKTYNYLTVVKEAEPFLAKAGYLSRRWIFRCVCGKEKSISPSNVFSNGILSCGCKKKEVCLKAIKKYYTEKYEFPVENKLYGNYAYHWNIPKREFKLTKDEFNKLVNSNCYYCGTLPVLIRHNKTKSVSKALNGIDRVDSSKGYTMDNVVSCCVNCNRAKMDRSIEDFKSWIVQVYNNMKKEGKLTIMNVDTHEYFQSDSVETLYINEKGRN